MSAILGEERELNLKDTELCLGLPGGGGETGDVMKVTGKRGFSETVDLKLNIEANESSAVDLKENMKNAGGELNIPPKDPVKPPAKAQVVGWPPVRSSRKNIMAHLPAAFVKVSMDGAPYLRKVDLNMYQSYQQLSHALANMFSSFTMGNYGTQGMIDFMNERKLMDLLNRSEYVPTYEDKDGDWMLVGDVPWEMFIDSCKRLRIMKGSEAIGLGYIGEFEFVDDHRSGKIVVELNGRLNKCGVISPRFDIGVKDIEGWTARLLPSRQFGYIVLTTSAGIMDHEEARRKNVGGKVLGFFY
ncbi:hypothetical protein F511_01639 [Dorcoceras hygrometricum]|nr:hypothetical protein F511_01639 [Dorcoceras hygrometricum]